MPTPLALARETIDLATALAIPAHGIASRVLARAAGGQITLFAFDAGESIAEHVSPSEAFLVTLEGRLDLTIGGDPVALEPGRFVHMPAQVPHALAAPVPTRALLVMLKA